MAKQHKRSYPTKKKEIRFHTVEIKHKKHKKPFKMWHPAYVFLQKDDIFIYVTLTHSNNVSGCTVIKLTKNPNPKDTTDSYFVTDFKEDKIDAFTKMRKEWQLDEKDDKLIRAIYKLNKKR